MVQWLQDWLGQVIDISHKDFIPVAEWRQKCVATEPAKFDPDHYVADFFEDRQLEVLSSVKWWTCRNDVIFGKESKPRRCPALVFFSEAMLQNQSWDHATAIENKNLKHGCNLRWVLAPRYLPLDLGRLCRACSIPGKTKQNNQSTNQQQQQQNPGPVEGCF